MLPLIAQALNTLGDTKWRINKRVLSIIDRIWASGGRLADLVDREDVGNIYTKILFFFLFTLLRVFESNYLFCNCSNYRFLYQRNQTRKTRQKSGSGNGRSKL